MFEMLAALGQFKQVEEWFKGAPIGKYRYVTVTWSESRGYEVSVWEDAVPHRDPANPGQGSKMIAYLAGPDLKATALAVMKQVLSQ